MRRKEPRRRRISEAGLKSLLRSSSGSFQPLVFSMPVGRPAVNAGSSQCQIRGAFLGCLSGATPLFFGGPRRLPSPSSPSASGKAG